MTKPAKDLLWALRMSESLIDSALAIRTPVTVEETDVIREAKMIRSALRHAITKAEEPSIAAAPDLLVACKTLKAFLAGLEHSTDPEDPLREIRRHIHAPLHAVLDAAIAKAEGRAGAK